MAVSRVANNKLTIEVVVKTVTVSSLQPAIFKRFVAGRIGDAIFDIPAKPVELGEDPARITQVFRIDGLAFHDSKRFVGHS